jgi:hypothetical protein
MCKDGRRVPNWFARPVGWLGLRGWVCAHAALTNESCEPRSTSVGCSISGSRSSTRSARAERAVARSSRMPITPSWAGCVSSESGSRPRSRTPAEHLRITNVNHASSARRARRVGDAAGMPVREYSRVVEGELSQELWAVFAGTTLAPKDGNTLLVGQIRDQAELQGLPIDRVVNTVSQEGSPVSVSRRPSRATPGNVISQSPAARQSASKPVGAVAALGSDVQVMVSTPGQTCTSTPREAASAACVTGRSCQQRQSSIRPGGSVRRRRSGSRHTVIRKQRRDSFTVSGRALRHGLLVDRFVAA